jgi:hypothetical protein
MLSVQPERLECRGMGDDGQLGRGKWYSPKLGGGRDEEMKR